MRILILIFSFFFFVTIICSQNKNILTLYFDLDKSILNEKSIKQIDSLTSIKNIDSIEIITYTDFLGSQDYNQDLSNKRAENVYNYMLKKSISKNKILVCNGLGVYPNSNYWQRKDTSDRGIASHRIALIKYSIFTATEEEKPKTDTISKLIFNYKELEIGNQIVIENILFVGGTAYFKPESRSALEELLETMENYQSLEIEIQGHICCQVDGADGYDIVNKNYHLSLNRAKAVYDYLVSEGISANRMTYKGLGSSNKRFPLERNEKEEDMNRRVEIKILNK